MPEVKYEDLPEEWKTEMEKEADKQQCIKSFDYKTCSIQEIEIDDLKKELTSSIDVEGVVGF